MNVTCGKCKTNMECIAKRQPSGSLTTISEYRCLDCHYTVQIGRKGIRQSDDISMDRDTSG